MGSNFLTRSNLTNFYNIFAKRIVTLQLFGKVVFTVKRYSLDMFTPLLKIKIQDKNSGGHFIDSLGVGHIQQFAGAVVVEDVARAYGYF